MFDPPLPHETGRAQTAEADLAGVAPGPQLVTTLASLDVAVMNDAMLVEATAGWERAAAWVTAQQATVLNELRRRREAQRRVDYVGDEVAARLATTRAVGEAKVCDAWALQEVPQVWDALSTGRIDARKARVMTTELLAVPPDAREEATASALEVAERKTGPQLRSHIRRAALAADPRAAEAAHRRAVADRHVELQPVEDGMAWIHALLPAPEAVAVHTALTAMADAQGRDDPRSQDARRADALVDTVTRWLDAGTTPDGVPLPARQRRRPHLRVTADVRTVLGLADLPGELAGYGPIDAQTVRRIAAASTWRPLLLDADGSLAARGHRGYRPASDQVDWIVDRDGTCTFPGCRVPAERSDIDHNTPFDPEVPAEGQTVADAMDAKCRHHHRMKTHGGWTTRRDTATGVTVWTAPTGHSYGATDGQVHGEVRGKVEEEVEEEVDKDPPGEVDGAGPPNGRPDLPSRGPDLPSDGSDPGPPPF